MAGHGTVDGMADTARIERVRRFWADEIGDPSRDHAIYHPDAVLEFPQSGERFEGIENMRAWRHRYPAEVTYHVARITGGDDVVVTELWARYDGGPWMPGVQLLEFDGDLVARERIYVMEAWDAAEWRAPWRSPTPAQPPAPD
jgi:hypothetical protein